ncbi:MAG: bifunctional riboflavin kinase/FAD synthetase [Planctomycetota bacterium]|jgi:riboflavin kinase/FMN adenylyltransferase
MKIIETLSEIEKIKKGCVLSIGNFDGVHLGHQKILTAARKIAAKNKTQLIAMTFEPHPISVLQPHKSPFVLTPLSLKMSLLAQFEVDCLFIQQSTPELLSLSPHDFTDDFLVKAIQPNVLVEGHDFNFGSQRTGNIQKLQMLGDEKGFEVCVVEAKKIQLSTGQTVRVSSTIIRNLLETGSVADAALALGRPYRLIGRVVPGHGKGKQLGFPTANLEPLQQIIPAEAVYAGYVQSSDTVEDVCPTKERLPAAFSIGGAQTLGYDRPKLIEAHLLTENVPELVGKWLAMDFVKHLRDQKKFDTEKDLAGQIKKDCENVKQILTP